MSRPKSRAFVDKVLKKQLKNREQFMELVELDVEEQAEFFIKSFIFTVDYKEVSKLAETFQKYLDSKNEKTDLTPVEAADFLQRNGKTRTAKERTEELADIDLDANGRICFIEYLLLHYKVMILSEFLKRDAGLPQLGKLDLSKDGVGLVGVGDMLLEELFTMPVGLSVELEEAIEEFMELKKKRAQHIKSLEEKAEAGGVKGLGAKNELAQFMAQDTTELNRVELTLQAAKRRAEKESPEVVLAKKRAEEEKKAQEAKEKSRAALAAKAAAFSTTKV